MNASNVNIVEYDEFKAKLDEVKNACNFLPDVSTDDGYKKSKRVALDVGKLLTALEAKRKELKAESLAFGRKVDSEAKGIAAQLEAFQLPHKEAYKTLDNQKKERERLRKEKLELRVEEIRNLPEAMRDSDSEGVKMAIESLNCEECLDFYEYTEQALKARNSAKESLAVMFSDKLKYEKEQKELAELRRKQAEQEQKDRDKRIAREAAEKAEQAAVEQAAEAVRQREAAEAKAKEDAKRAEAKARQDAIEAEERAKQAVIDAENRLKREAEEKAAAEAADLARREANKHHAKKINNEAAACFVTGGFTKEQAQNIVTMIAKKEIDHVVINY